LHGEERVDPVASLGLFRLVPTADPDDPRWDVALNHGIVIVRAESPADARIVAAQAETDALKLPSTAGHGSAAEFSSGFRDEKLYSCDEDVSGNYPVAGPRGLVAGRLGQTAERSRGEPFR
jgi:hypothetical protein